MPEKKKETSVSRIDRYKSAPLHIQVRTFGCPLPTVCDAVNLSMNGLLISSDPRKIPFQVKTLVEIEIKQEKNLNLNEDISFIGKVVRFASPKEKKSGKDNEVYFGVKIIDIDDPKLEVWKSHLSFLGSQAKNNKHA